MATTGIAAIRETVEIAATTVVTVITAPVMEIREAMETAAALTMSVSHRY
jgi:flavin-binding protein dodecin